MTLRDLEIGDLFVTAKDRRKVKTLFVVRGSSLFNTRNGSATRWCTEAKTGKTVSKSCRIDVVKIGVSKQIEEYIKPR